MHEITVTFGGIQAETFRFRTQAEVDAFLMGVASMDGWRGYTVVSCLPAPEEPNGIRSRGAEEGHNEFWNMIDKTAKDIDNIRNKLDPTEDEATGYDAHQDFNEEDMNAIRRMENRARDQGG